MNYEELRQFILNSTRDTSVLEYFDNAIETPTNGMIGIAILHFCQESDSHDQDGIFARELIEYIDGMNENQDNGDDIQELGL